MNTVLTDAGARLCLGMFIGESIPAALSGMGSTLKLYTSNPTASGTLGEEISYLGYTPQFFTWSGGTTFQNSVAIQFPRSNRNLEITHIGVFRDDIMVLFGELPVPMKVIVGGHPRFEINDIQFVIPTHQLHIDNPSEIDSSMASQMSNTLRGGANTLGPMLNLLVALQNNDPRLDPQSFEIARTSDIIRFRAVENNPRQVENATDITFPTVTRAGTCTHVLVFMGNGRFTWTESPLPIIINTSDDTPIIRAGHYRIEVL